MKYRRPYVFNRKMLRNLNASNKRQENVQVRLLRNSDFRQYINCFSMLQLQVEKGNYAKRTVLKPVSMTSKYFMEQILLGKTEEVGVNSY
ncbi:hypothetical protein Tco_1107718 [Tanacetum coccineum]